MTRTVIYSMAVSLDGFIAGPGGEIDWAAPDEELMRFHNLQTREIGAHLCGRGLYEDMLPWESAEQTRSDPLEVEFARIWKAIPKMVFSTTLHRVEGNARLARADVADEVAELAGRPGRGVVSAGGARFAATLIRLGSHRRVPAVRQSDRAGRRHTVLPAPPPAARPGAARDADVRLRRRLPPLPADARRAASGELGRGTPGTADTLGDSPP